MLCKLNGFFEKHKTNNLDFGYVKANFGGWLTNRIKQIMFEYLLEQIIYCKY